MKIPKSKELLLRECEEHLFMLKDALSLYRSQRYRYKQIAAELRVLVCEFRSNKPLLLDMMDEYGFTYEVQPWGRSPIPLIGDIDSSLNKKIGQLLIEGKHQEADKLISSRRKPILLRYFVKKGLAVYMRPNEISYNTLIRKIAEQEGSSHEDRGVDSEVNEMKNIHLGGEESHIACLINFSDVVVEAGQKFFEFLSENGHYTIYIK